MIRIIPFAFTVVAAVTQAATTHHQGVVAVQGERFTGPGAFRFALVDPDTNAYLWTNDGSAVAHPDPPINAVALPVVNGVYQVGLGDTLVPNMIAIPPAIIHENDDLVLRIWFDDQQGHGTHRLLPDLNITPVPYAQHAAAAERINVPGTDTTAVFVDNAGQVGIGTDNPEAPLEVAGRIRSTEVVTDDVTVMDSLAVVGGNAAFGQNVGIGVTIPGQRLSVNGGVTVDFSGGSDGDTSRALRFGADDSGEAIASKRTNDGNQFGLDFYTDDAPRMSIRSNGNVGIGTDSPEAPLEVAGLTRTSALEITAGESLAPFLAGWGDNDFGQIDVPPGTYSAVAAGLFHSAAIHDDGILVGWGNNVFGEIDVPPGTYTAVAAGGYHSLALGAAAGPSPGLLLAQDAAFKPGTNTWTIWSDRRLKKDIEPLSGALERILQLRGMTFQWIDPTTYGRDGTQIGLIADDVQSVFPQWVGTDPDGYRTLTIGGFEALTAEALRDLRAEKDRELAERDATIESLKAQNTELYDRLEEIERSLNVLSPKRVLP